jgi:nucleoside phosphorylase
MLDEQHEQLPQPPVDHNIYTLGSINSHNVVIAGLPVAGNNRAATTVTQMRNTFPALRFGVLVGIGGGVPTETENGPIRVGDVVVSKPTAEHSGAVQYDHGKAEAGQFKRTGFLQPPPAVLLNASQDMAAKLSWETEDPLMKHIIRINTDTWGLRNYRYPGPVQDHLYHPNYTHLDSKRPCQDCGCDTSQRVDRRDDGRRNFSSRVTVHRGTIASGELVMKNGLLRDELAEQYGVLCFEMEAAGASADFPCLVIRGISDYSDSHKNDQWQAYARQLFFHMPVDQVKQLKVVKKSK